MANKTTLQEKEVKSQFKAISAIHDKDGALIGINEVFDSSRLTNEAAKKFLKLEAIERVNDTEADEVSEETSEIEDSGKENS